jgi:ribosomal protein S18 acetylase RimI-like enzyme
VNTFDARLAEMIVGKSEPMSAEGGGINVRDATGADIPSLAELHVRTFAETHGGGPARSVRERQWRDKFEDPSSLLFCIVLETSSGELIGFASGQTYNEAELGEFKGELNKIYLLREYHGRGLGRRLLCSAAQRFLSRGVTSMLLFGDARSSSNGFYEAMGAERLLSFALDFHGAYGWRDLQTLAARCLAS